MKVLLVDDEFNVRDVIRYFGQWDRLGVTDILEAGNGEEAQAMIEKERPEIIFADIKMPKMNGIQLLEWLNETSYPGKVIIVSGYDDYAYMRKAIQCSSFDYLLKPIEPDALNTALEGAIQAWRADEAKRQRDADFSAQERWLQGNRSVTAASEGKPFNWEELAVSLPKADTFDLTLLNFYQSYNANDYIKPLSDELVLREWGNAFVLQTDPHVGVVISKCGQLPAIEKWIINHMDVPIRLVSGEPISSMKELPDSFESAKKALFSQNFKTLHRLSESDDARRWNDIVEYLMEHYTDELCLDTLAGRFFLSREHISRSFKQEMGMNISNYLIQLRIEHAKRLLSQTEEKMYAIAVKVGYQNEKYFSKLFKRVVGMTPAQYRSLYRENKKEGSLR